MKQTTIATRSREGGGGGGGGGRGGGRRWWGGGGCAVNQYHSGICVRLVKIQTQTIINFQKYKKGQTHPR